MKRFLMVAAAMLALAGQGQVAMRALEDIDNVDLVCVTNYGPQVVSLTARVTGLEGSSNDWSKTVSNLAALSNNVSALSSRVTATNALFSAWFAGLQSRTSYWDAAYSWGDWAVAVGANTAAIAVLQTNTVTRAGTNGFVTASITNGLASTSYVASAVSGLASITITNGLASTSYVAAAVAAIPAAGAFWPRNATASSWFTFVTNSGAITITGYNIVGGTDVVIPDYINGLPVTEIGVNAFGGSDVESIGGAGNVVTVGGSAFSDCSSLTSVLLPQVLTVGTAAFSGCYSLASVSLPQVLTVRAGAFYFCHSLASVYFDNHAPTIGANIFADITPNQVTNYVTNPQATGWGATFGGMPVVRLPLYADAIYQAGELVATVSDIEAHNADAAAHAGKVSGAYPSSNPSNYVTSAVATNISQSLISATCSQTCIRAWMPLTTHSQYGYVDLPAASNSTVALGPAPLNSFVVRVSVPAAISGAQYTFSNIVLYAGSHTTPPESQGFTACTTGVFTASNWNLLSPTGYLMRRDDSKMRYGSARRDILAYSLGMDEKVRLFCWWSPATPAELAAGTNVFYYGSDAQ